MKCEICDVQTATMWVQPPPVLGTSIPPKLSCPYCGPQLGYKILASLEPTYHR